MAPASDNESSEDSKTSSGEEKDAPPLFLQGDLSEDEKQDLFATVEHLLIVGNHRRHQNWRIQEYNLRQQKQQSEEHNSNEPAAKRQRKLSSSDPDQDRLVHLQDARLYGSAKAYRGTTEPPLWPKEPKNVARVVVNDDQNWDLELSDGIHPLHFSQMRLTAALLRDPPSVDAASGITTTAAAAAAAAATEDDDSSGDDDQGPGAFYDLDGDSSTNNTISKQQASRTLLLHCWERAVHAAASTVGVARSTEPPSPHQQLQPQVQQDPSPEQAVAVCQNLQIEVPNQQQQQQQETNSSDIDNDDSSNMASTTTNAKKCHVCQVEFASFDKLQQHFYGTVTTKGCCWLAIQQKRRQLIDSILQTELQQQQEQLIRLVMIESLKQQQVRGNDNDNNTISWNHVLEMVQGKLASARKVRIPGGGGSNTNNNKKDDGERESVLETLELETGKPPLPINPAVLEAVRNRLIDRYAVVPR